MHKTGWSITVGSGIMISVKEQEPVKTACIFGVQQILPLLDAFLQEIEGVRSTEDIEHIHRMRVASRRLRAALPLFESCFPPKTSGCGCRNCRRLPGHLAMHGIRMSREIFGATQKKKEITKNNGIFPASTRLAVPQDDAETILLRQLQKRRRKLQSAVLSALENLEKGETPEDIKFFAPAKRALCSGKCKEPEKMSGMSPASGICQGGRIPWDFFLVSDPPWGRTQLGLRRCSLMSSRENNSLSFQCILFLDSIIYVIFSREKSTI
jgi:hypothetical protein